MRGGKAGSDVYTGRGAADDVGCMQRMMAVEASRPSVVSCGAGELRAVFSKRIERGAEVASRATVGKTTRLWNRWR
jgi:hypothetical protein